MINIKTYLLRIFYKGLLKPIFFRIDPELVHDNITKLGYFFGKHGFTRFITRAFFSFQDPTLEQQILGIDFINPVGLSAGFDKDANLARIVQDVGFGFTQIGSITHKPYEGNPKPRLYRLPHSKGLVVYYGLKNLGANKIIKKIQTINPSKFVKSISIAKTNSSQTSTTEAGIEDYYNCFKKVTEAGVGDFYTINISCPNTFGGEPFTSPDKLDKLLKRIHTLEIQKPIFLKMPVDLNWDEFKNYLMLLSNIKSMV